MPGRGLKEKELETSNEARGDARQIAKLREARAPRSMVGGCPTYSCKKTDLRDVVGAGHRIKKGMFPLITSPLGSSPCRGRILSRAQR